MARFRIYSVRAGSNSTLTSVHLLCEPTDATDADRQLGLIDRLPHHIVKSDGGRHTIVRHTSATSPAYRLLVENMLKAGSHPACREPVAPPVVVVNSLTSPTPTKSRVVAGTNAATVESLLAEFGTLNEALRCARLGVAVERAVKGASNGGT